MAGTAFAVVLIAGSVCRASAADSTIKSDQVRASKIEGTAVYDVQNEEVASVKDLILDKSGKVDDVVLSYGTTLGVGGKYVAVAFDTLKFDNNRLTIDKTKQQLDAMPSYTLEDTNTGAGEGPVPPTGGKAH
jgi:sporulation protein YlmC with PRC-barrel domain